MRRMLDTSTLIDILRGEPSVTARFRAADPSELVVSAVSAGELMAGAARANDVQRELFAVDMLLRPLPQLPLDAAATRRSGLLDAHLRRAGTPIGTSVRLVAATALEHDAIVVTSDTRDFARVPFLVTESWRAD